MNETDSCGTEFYCFNKLAASFYTGNVSMHSAKVLQKILRNAIKYLTTQLQPRRMHLIINNSFVFIVEMILDAAVLCDKPPFKTELTTEIPVVLTSTKTSLRVTSATKPAEDSECVAAK